MKSTRTLLTDTEGSAKIRLGKQVSPRAYQDVVLLLFHGFQDAASHLRSFMPHHRYGRTPREQEFRVGDTFREQVVEVATRIRDDGDFPTILQELVHMTKSVGIRFDYD